ncbi:hypothetical protein IVB14_29895 [Bradyrhizobium sp. 180]|uniref:hypothetical protein n=1 Tax=unclassified Bradyrhizobium TaxID=2631580 RepID=UPI001FF8F4ED|nr:MULTISPECIES: hypothetical protein [unclassified Bradyrhizobium]MCK1419291.1 hypothetical protein [Bradyrhizobium sp. CW12]MCK1494509.1 hypothetical protein [Bradyrhizobium sp. 180]MCK1526952.1 hypothetical protein [Bradyrhizobium sp. 182]MCK1595376.1 hypothetical protein [Bradyrhizobium sp. 164]MCK1620292.1 hypothetical protein [Bradyrhizobium sp. 159]
MAISVTECSEQLDSERRHLTKANEDIEEGSKRIRDQEDRVRELMAGGHDAGEAERLVALLKQTLTEWERHRVLIEERVAYLQHEIDPALPR